MNDLKDNEIDHKFCIFFNNFRKKFQLLLYIKISNQQTSSYGVPNNAESSRHPIHLVNMGINNDDEHSNSQMLYDDGDDDVESGKLKCSRNNCFLDRSWEIRISFLTYFYFLNNYINR